MPSLVTHKLKTTQPKFLFFLSNFVSFVPQRAALNVELVDENFPAADFDYMSGFRQVKWPKIASGSNVSHVAVVRPKITGLYNFTSAAVSYLPSDKAEKPQVSHLNLTVMGF